MSLLKAQQLSVPHPPFFFCLPVCVYRLVAKPCAHILQIQAGVPRQAQPNAVLEKLYQSKMVYEAHVCSVVHQIFLYTLEHIMIC